MSKQKPAQTDGPQIQGEKPAATVRDEDIELKSALAEAQQEAAQNRDAYLRMAAELENLRKRSQRDVENAHKFALERFMAELLPVRDSLEMGLSAANIDADSLREGMAMTLKLLTTAIERAGVSEVNPTTGEAFNPELHEAMAMQESSEVESGTVLQTMQKGYVLNGRLLRPARVIVAKAPDVAA